MNHWGEEEDGNSPLDQEFPKLVGVQIGIIGKISGRARAGQYYIVRGFKPALRNIGLKVDYSHSISNSKYGIFGIHVWIHYV